MRTSKIIKYIHSVIIGLICIIIAEYTYGNDTFDIPEQNISANVRAGRMLNDCLSTNHHTWKLFCYRALHYSILPGFTEKMLGETKNDFKNRITGQLESMATDYVNHVKNGTIKRILAFENYIANNIFYLSQLNIDDEQFLKLMHNKHGIEFYQYGDPELENIEKDENFEENVLWNDHFYTSNGFIKGLDTYPLVNEKDDLQAELSFMNKWNSKLLADIVWLYNKMLSFSNSPKRTMGIKNLMFESMLYTWWMLKNNTVDPNQWENFYKILDLNKIPQQDNA